MEAVACGRDIFWTRNTPELYEASEELRENGIGVLIQYSGQSKAYLDAWTSGPWQSPVSVPPELLRDLGLIGEMDGPDPY